MGNVAIPYGNSLAYPRASVYLPCRDSVSVQKESFVITAIKFLSLLFLSCGLAISLPSTASEDNGTFEEIQSLINARSLERALTVMKTQSADDNLTEIELNILRAMFLIESGRPRRALQLIEEVSFQTTLHESLINVVFAQAFLKIGELSQAESFAEKAILADKASLAAHVVKLSVLGEISGRVQSQEFEELLDQSDHDPQVWFAYLEQTLRLPPFQSNLAKRAFVEIGESGITKDYLARFLFNEGEKHLAYQQFSEAQKAYELEGNSIASARIGRWLSIYSGFQANPKQASPETKYETEKNLPGDLPEKNDVAPTLQPAVVNDNLEIEPISIHTEGDVFTGSGFIANDGRWVITNRHVIEGADRALVRDGVGKIREVEEYYLDESQDIAVLVLEEAFPREQAVSFSDIVDPVGGDELFLMGYPLAGILGASYPSITEGIVSKQAGFDDEISEFLITANLNQGNSGGPIFSTDGRVLGIAVAKLDKSSFFRDNETIPEDVNVGIKGSELRRFVDYRGPLNNEPLPILTPREAYRQLRSKVVFIVAVDD